MAIHGEKQNSFQPGIGHGLPMNIPDGVYGTVEFKYLSDGHRYHRHVPLDEIGNFRIGQKLTQVTTSNE